MAQQAVRELTELSNELRIEVESFSADLAAAEEKTATLERRLAEEAKKSEQLQATEREMVEKEQELRSQRTMLFDKGASKGSLSGRVLDPSPIARARRRG